MVTLTARRERVDQLARLLDGTLPEEGARADVRRLAALASTVTREVPTAHLDEATRDRLRQRVMFEVHVGLSEPATPTPVERVGRSTRTAIATGMASLLLATTGVTVAAQEALPGDALYGIKRATESVRMAVVGDATERGRLELVLAAERLSEVTEATTRGGALPSHLIDTLARMDARTIAGVETLAAVAEQGDAPDIVTDLAGFLHAQTNGLIDVYSDLPVTVRPYAEDSLALLRQLDDQRVRPLVASCSGCSAELIVSAFSTDPLVSPELPARTGTGGGEGASGDPAGGDTDGTTDPTATTSGLDDTISGLDDSTSGDDSSGLVPALPGALSGVGDAVDRSLGAVIDGAEGLLDDTGDELDETTDMLEDEVDDLLDPTTDPLGGLLP